ncbi:serine/threonine-protein kinase [Nocardioides alcanivorans]|uniref:serine/threonine-protein kinase n=1 Tax=Nocardioides alcanivorans TaxID=2897352 RepID=UPI001F3864CA|nr:serine/threonine-protein kinase [Nocardioides alcanivorans]
MSRSGGEATVGPVPGIELGPEIGRGGFATVHRGIQLSVGREVAVKIDSRPFEDERNRRRFLREATASSRISGHPHVVSLIDVGTTRDGRAYLVMELCPHGSLGDVLRAHGPLSAAEARDLGLAVCGALAAAHEAGIVHRDVKPSNVLIDAFGAPRLSDFGLAALPQPGRDLSVTLEALTPAYASPEAFDNRPPTPRSDVWSMGATLHAMISRVSPRRTADGSLTPIPELIARLAEPMPDPGVPGSAELMQVIARACAYDPADRYPTAREMYDDLRSLHLPSTTTVRRVAAGPDAVFTSLPTGRPSPPRGSRRWPGLVAATALGLAVGIGTTMGHGAFLDGEPTDPDPAARASTATTDGAVADGQPADGQLADGQLADGQPADHQPADTATEEPPAVGTCWGGMTNMNGQITANEGDCADDHYYETFASGLLDPEIETPYLRDLVQDPNVVATCTEQALLDYLGDTDRHDDKTLSVDVFPPDVIAFTRGERGFSCVVSVDGEGTRTGSLTD